MLHIHYTLLTQWLHANPQWGGFAAFIIAFSESIAILGTIIPGSVTMTAIGILAGSGVLPIWSVIGFGIAGAIIGDGFSYFVGYRYKNNLQNVWPFSHHPSLFITGEKFFIKHGALSVFIGRFVGPVRAIVPLIAGMLNMRPPRYFLASIPAAICWAPGYMLPGILLGAASLEMPADVATGLIITVLAFLVLIWLLAKLTTFLYNKTHHYFSEHFDRKWEVWEQQPSKRWFCELLRHASRPGKRGQILLAINMVIAFTLFVILYINVVIHGPLIGFNNAVYHLFRGLRTPTLDKVMLVITTLGFKNVLLPLVITLTAWFAFRKKWLAAIHWFMNGLIVSGAIFVCKSLHYNPRPTGTMKYLTSSSFPSGHTTLTVALFGFLAFLIATQLPKEKRKIVYWIATIIAVSVGISRIYLEAHWFTDVVGGTLLGLFVIAFTVLSYRRYRPDRLSILGILLVTVLTLGFTGSWNLYHNYHKYLHGSKAIWPTHYLSKQIWWHQHATLIPLFRNDRFGNPTELLNVQWAGNIEHIRTTLKQHGWHNPHTRDYLSTLKTLAEQNVAKHHSFIAKLYNDQHPVLELTKFVTNQSPPLILRLWQSNIKLMPNNTPLWVGTIYYRATEKHLIFFYKRAKHIRIEEAANALIPSLIEYTWHMKIVKPRYLPLALMKEHLLDRVIIIQPRN